MRVVERGGLAVADVGCAGVGARGDGAGGAGAGASGAANEGGDEVEVVEVGDDQASICIPDDEEDDDDVNVPELYTRTCSLTFL